MLQILRIVKLGKSFFVQILKVELPPCKVAFIAFEPATISSVIRRPAMLAVTRETKQPAMKARNATFVIECLLVGASALKPPIMMPIELGLAKPQIE